MCHLPPIKNAFLIIITVHLAKCWTQAKHTVHEAPEGAALEIVFADQKEFVSPKDMHTQRNKRVQYI